MRIVLTGGTGFLGKAILKKLIEQNHSVLVISRNENLKKDFPHVPLLICDLKEITDKQRQFLSFAPEVIIHPAWDGVQGAYRNDTKQFDNLSIHVSLLELAKLSGIHTFIGFGSQAEYGPQNIKLREEAACQPTTYYGMAKLQAGDLQRRILSQYNLRSIWFRVFSLYGPGDHPVWLIPYIIRSLVQGSSPKLTDGQQLWDYLYIEDAAEAICKAILHPSMEGVYNLGSGQTVQIRSLIEMIRDEIAPQRSLDFGNLPYRPDQIYHLEADITKLHKHLGWSPKKSLLDGLRQTIAYYAQN